MNNNRSSDWTPIVLIALVAFSRLIPHWPNFTPVMAIALFAGFSLKSRILRFVIPLAAMAISDLVLGLVLGSGWLFHDTTLYVYGAVVLGVFVGIAMKVSTRWKQVVGGGALASIMFFLVSNFGVWAGGTMYPMNITGLITCYEAGLVFSRDQGGSFFLNLLLSTWLFTAILVYARSFVASPSGVRHTFTNRSQ